MIEGPFCFFQTVSLGTLVNKGIKRKGHNAPWDSTLPHARFSAPLPVES